MSITSKSVML